MPGRCNTLWIGSRLGAVERACMASVLRQGHALSLYCYREPEGVPHGVEMRDAAAILPEDRLIRHISGSVSPFSDWFRYELQRRGRGTWVDTDVYLVAPLDDGEDHLFGFQSTLINGAVLRIPASSPMLPPLIAVFQENAVPAWLSWTGKAAARWRLMRSGRSGIGQMPWGATGPLALTALARRHRLDTIALPTDTFYPVPWERADWILDPSLRLEDVLTSRTVAVHLWNECIKAYKDSPAPPGSFLARLQDEGRRA